MSIQINGTSGISGVDGTAGTPALQGTDSNTGISFGADQVNINTGGSTRATVDSSGRLLVGTSSARTGFFNGTAPTKLQIENAGAGTAEASFVRDENNTNGGLIIIGKSRGTTAGSNTVVQSGDEIGTVDFQAADGTDFVIGARISAAVDATASANVMPGRLTFSTTGVGASSPTERMRITATGAIIFDGNTASAGWASPGTLHIAQRGVGWSALTSEGYGDGIGFCFAVKQSASASGGEGWALINYNSSNTVVGGIKTSTTGTTFNITSDHRLKENIVPLTGAIDRVNQLQVHRFNFIANPGKTVDGFLAHEAQVVVPEAVTGRHNEVEVWRENEELPDGVSIGDNKLDEEGNTIPVHQCIDQSKLVPLLTAALQEALAKIETLETRLNALEGGTN